MSNLQNLLIRDTYDGLIHTADENAIDGTPKYLQDGAGNNLPVQVATNLMVYTGEQDFSGATVTGIGGGGGGTAAMGLDSLPPVRGSFLSATESFRTWVATTGYATGSVNTSNNQGTWSVFSMAEGQTISKIVFGVTTAVASSNLYVGIYQVRVDANNQMIMAELMKDCGSVSSATTGLKQINLATPFTMPAGEPFGAVAILIVGDTAGTNCTTWGSAVWSGNGGRSIGDTTWYRSVGFHITGSFSGLPAGIGTSYNYATTTGGPLWIGIQ